MEPKRNVVAFLIAIVLGLIMIIGCAKPPVEKLTELQNELKELEAKGAEIFASIEYERALGDLESAQQMMDQKKYRDAKFCCDRLEVTLKSLRDEVENNSFYKVKDTILSAETELKNLKKMLNDSMELLSTDEVKKFRNIVSEYESKLKDANDKLAKQEYIKAFNDAKSLKETVSDSVTELAQLMEQAKDVIRNNKS